MNENDLTPETDEPEADDSAQSGDETALSGDDTLVLPQSAEVIEQADTAADDEVSTPEDSEPADPPDDAETLILARAAVPEAVPATSEAETLVTVVAAEVEEEAAVSLPAEDWNLDDIDAALAAVASLSEMMPEREAEAEARADSRQGKPTFVPEMKLPPLTTLKRGQLGSIVPALLLIGIGAWLTLATTSGTPPDSLLVAVVIVGGIVLSLLAQWLGTGRWSRGALFFALLILLIGGVVALSLQPQGIDLLRGWPLLIVALGLAMALSGLLARPLNARLLAPGALIVLAGMVGLTVTLGLAPASLTGIATPLGPILLVIVLVIWMLPLVFRRRSNR